jgi:histidine triad (HIT) family protein
MEKRVAFDVDAYTRRTQTGGCFICALQRGDPRYEHELIASDDAHITFLSRYPTLQGYALVAPKAHMEQVVGDFGDTAFLAMMAFVRRVAQGVETVRRPSARICCRWGASRATPTCSGTSPRCRSGLRTTSSSTTR